MRPELDPGLMPSMLDRLIDPESGGTAWRRGYGVEQMFQAVKRDLEDLLNTRQTHVGLSREYEQLHSSIYAYGLPDLGSLTAADVQQRDAFARVIETIIARFEPRLRDVRVRVVTTSSEAPLDFKVRFHVDARLCLDPAPAVAFDTILELSTGQYAIQSPGA